MAVLFEQQAKQVIQMLSFVLKLEKGCYPENCTFYLMSKILVNNQDNPFAVKQRDADTKEPQIEITKRSYQVIRALKAFHDAGLKTAPKQSKMCLLNHQYTTVF